MVCWKKFDEEKPPLNTVVLGCWGPIHMELITLDEDGLFYCQDGDSPTEDPIYWSVVNLPNELKGE